MKKITLLILFSVLLSLSTTSLVAQENTTENNPFSIGCDLMSRYVWRGTDYGASPSIQPGIEYSIGGFAIGTWGAFTTNLPGVQEVDLYASYTFNNVITLTFTDYFFPDEVAGYKYFNYKKSTTGHVFEGMLSFNGTEKVPLSAFVATNFYGADAKKVNDDGSEGDIQFSTYAEIAYTFKYVDVFMGINCTSPDKDKGETGYYGDSFGVVNLGLTTSKDIVITDKFSLPLTASLITNPQAEKIYLVVGLSF